MQRFAFSRSRVVLTGAASGIGLELAKELAFRFCHLALIDRDEAGLHDLASDLRARYPRLDISTHVVDLANAQAREGLAEEVLQAQGVKHVDLLINNAGVALRGNYGDFSWKDISWLMNINLIAVMDLTHQFLPALRAAEAPQIVNLSSLFGITAPAGQVPYAAAKFGVRGFSEALRHELAAEGIGVTVVHPGGIATNIAKRARVAEGIAAQQDAYEQELAERGLRTSPEQVAQEILYAVLRRKGRVLITPESKLADLWVRLTPAHYWKPIDAALQRRHRRVTK